VEVKKHWDSVYGMKAPDAVSWYAPHLTESLAYIQVTGLPRTAAVIDVGGGEATLVDDLLAEGYADVSVLDISAKALEVCRHRLGNRGLDVKWIAANVLKHVFAPNSVDIWHDTYRVPLPHG
jgi:ubiquinone/menaquinone biosynthesis C-methylase UbiE